MHNPILALDADTIERCRVLAARKLGRPRALGLPGAIRRVLVERFPGPRITVSDKTRPSDREAMILRLLVSVDGKPDQAMIFGKARLVRELDCIRAIADEALDYARQHEADLYDAEPECLEHETAVDVAVSSIEALRNIQSILKRDDYLPVHRRRAV